MKLHFQSNQQSTQKILSACSGSSRESGLHLHHVSCLLQLSVPLGRGGGEDSSEHHHNPVWGSEMSTSTGAVEEVSTCRNTAKLIKKSF